MQAYRPTKATSKGRSKYPLCDAFLNGSCKSEGCTPDRHAMYPLMTKNEIDSLVPSVTNVLTTKARKADRFDDKYNAGPTGANGPRHDNDYESIADVKILPTIDEVS